jgi:hypothetical protein
MIRALSIWIMILASVLVFALCGCATKGGWPCFSWQKNTDQKIEAAGAEYIKQQSIAATNQPLPLNYNDVLKPSVGGFIPRVAPLPPATKIWKDANGCSWYSRGEVTNGPFCPQSHSNFVAFIYPADRSNYTWSVEASTDLKTWITVASNMLFGGDTEWTQPTTTSPVQFYRMRGDKL